MIVKLAILAISSREDITLQRGRAVKWFSYLSQDFLQK